MRYQVIVELDGVPTVVQVTPGTYQDKHVWLVNLDGRQHMLCYLYDEWMQRNEDDLTPAQVYAIGCAIENLQVGHQNTAMSLSKAS
ncbi:hypothetical protein MUY27_17755 [Mucilaginibacter sp. RS28]|uniref:Uncharacterized protein n=1 Tax=Mucilaginibacter straminoryzae TaxID=2932774 RepID=A0A9X1X7H3_9SPHI|nr:hypothetical protein [Mucilaginibacter straminoryzae]MCJ8211570.1 hypothetical protein [Mucilaginibacter straminoryzae]